MSKSTRSVAPSKSDESRGLSAQSSMMYDPRAVAIERATRRYATALRQGINPCRSDGDAESQAANFREALEYAAIRAGQIRQVLCDLGVLPMQFVSYRSFGLRVDKLVRKYEGNGLRVRVHEAILRWQWHGCSLDVLKAICEKVYGLDLTPPEPPQ